MTVMELEEDLREFSGSVHQRLVGLLDDPLEIERFIAELLAEDALAPSACAWEACGYALASAPEERVSWLTGMASPAVAGFGIGAGEGGVLGLRTKHGQGPWVVLDRLGPDLGVRLCELRSEEQLPSFDPSIGLAAGLPTSVSGEGSSGYPVLERAQVWVAAEASGVARRALSVGARHAREREQFGRPIGARQFVAGALVDSLVDGQLGKALLTDSLLRREQGDDVRSELSAAVETLTLTAVRSAEVCLQLHGALGLTWEHISHRLLRRADVLRIIGVRLRWLAGSNDASMSR